MPATIITTDGQFQLSSDYSSNCQLISTHYNYSISQFLITRDKLSVPFTTEDLKLTNSPIEELPLESLVRLLQINNYLNYEGDQSKLLSLITARYCENNYHGISEGVRQLVIDLIHRNQSCATIAYLRGVREWHDGRDPTVNALYWYKIRSELADYVTKEDLPLFVDYVRGESIDIDYIKLVNRLGGLQHTDDINHNFNDKLVDAIIYCNHRHHSIIYNPRMLRLITMEDVNSGRCNFILDTYLISPLLFNRDVNVIREILARRTNSSLLDVGVDINLSAEPQYISSEAAILMNLRPEGLSSSNNIRTYMEVTDSKTVLEFNPSQYYIAWRIIIDDLDRGIDDDDRVEFLNYIALNHPDLVVEVLDKPDKISLIPLTNLYKSYPELAILLSTKGGRIRLIDTHVDNIDNSLLDFVIRSGYKLIDEDYEVIDQLSKSNRWAIMRSRLCRIMNTSDNDELKCRFTKRITKNESLFYVKRIRFVPHTAEFEESILPVQSITSPSPSPSNRRLICYCTILLITVASAVYLYR